MPDTPTSINTADVLAIDASIAGTTAASPFGITRDGFNAKPFARLLAEKLALARSLFGDDLDLGSGSAIRKLLEISALEDARTWAALATMYDNSFVSTAGGDALSSLGLELGLPRPYLEAHGTVRLKLTGTLPQAFAQLTFPRGSRMLTAGGHHVATDETAVLSAASPQRDVSVIAFYPGPEHNLDPAVAAGDGSFPQKIVSFNPLDFKLEDFNIATAEAGGTLVTIEHTQALTGGELQWPDARYRDLVLQAPRSVWTVEAVRIAASLVPGVRQVQVRDGWGGLDINQSIFGNFNFIERLFGSERDLGTPYYFTVLVAPTPGAIWGGPDGLDLSVASAIEDLRPISIFPEIVQAAQIGIGISADLVVQGIPLPSGSRATVNASGPAVALKTRLMQRVRAHIDSLSFGEPVRASEVTWALMNEPGMIDVRNLQLVTYPPPFIGFDFLIDMVDIGPQYYACGANVPIGVNQIAQFVDDPTFLQIV